MGVLAVEVTFSGGGRLRHEHARVKFLLVWRLEHQQCQCQSEAFALLGGDWCLP